MVQFLDPETATILQFLDPEIVNMDPETTEILPILDPEIVKMDKKISGSRNCRNGAISGSRNCRKGRQILYVNKCRGYSCNLLYMFLGPFVSRGTRAQHLTLCVWCVVCGGVPWMDAMLRSVREHRQLYSHNDKGFVDLFYNFWIQKLHHF